MNDFTKEELEYIGDCIDFGLMDSDRNKSFEYLDGKVRALIDNYCEHSDAYETNIYATYCAECDKTIGEE